jgi:hypothetical protein
LSESIYPKVINQSASQPGERKQAQQEISHFTSKSKNIPEIFSLTFYSSQLETEYSNYFFHHCHQPTNQPLPLKQCVCVQQHCRSVNVVGGGL